MRFEKGHKAETRRHILNVAAAQFRKEGINAAGIAGIMSAAGLTNGAFYPHFKSKEELIREAVAQALNEQQHRIEENTRNGDGLEGVLRGYLNMAHCNCPERGCPSASLLPELARQPAATRKTYETAVNDYLGVIMPFVATDDPAIARKCATAIFSLMVGTLQYARTVTDADTARQILEDGIQSALVLATPAGA